MRQSITVLRHRNPGGRAFCIVLVRRRGPSPESAPSISAALLRSPEQHSDANRLRSPQAKQRIKRKCPSPRSLARSSSMSSPAARQIRACTVNKDQRGYGLTVHGTRPVIVQSVRAEGAAWKAGIRELDEILEVNGVPVEGKSHSEVVKLIKEKPCVEFKVTAGTGRRNGASTRQRTTITTVTTKSSGERRTVEPDQFRGISTISPEAAKYLKGSAKLQEELSASPGEKSEAPVVPKVGCGLRTSVTNPRPWVAVSHHRPAAPLLTEPLDDGVEFPLTHSKSCSMPEQASASLAAPKPTRSKSDAQKRRPVSMDVSQLEGAAAISNSNSSSSLVSKSSKGFFHNTPFISKNSRLTPSNYQVRQSTGNEDFDSKFSRSISFKRSESVKETKPKKRRMGSSRDKWLSQPRVDDTASTEEASTSIATPSPPPGVTATVSEGPGHRRTNSSEIFESPASHPSLTPEHQPLSIDFDDDDSYAPGEKMEMDEVRRQTELFSDLDKVLQRPDLTATLVLFGSRSVTSEGKTDFYRLLCLVVLADYQRCTTQRDNKDFVKDHKRVAYEIYSSFLAEGAPLDVKLSPSLVADVGEPFRREEEESSQTLKTLLTRARDSIVKEFKLLDEYRNQSERGLDTLYVGDYNFLSAPSDRQLMYLDNKMHTVFSAQCDQKEETPQKSALLSAFATVVKFFHCSDEKPAYRSMESLAFANAMPFNSKISKSRTGFPNFNKKRITHHMHSLSLKTIETIHACDYCSKIISGAAPQADVCHNCTSVVHRECREKWRRMCDRSKRTSLFGQFGTSNRKVKDPLGSSIHEPKKRTASREGSAEFVQPAISPGSDLRQVDSLINRFEKPDDDDIDSVTRSLPGDSVSLSRAESLKYDKRFDNPPWRNKSDSSQHSEAIQEAENLTIVPPGVPYFQDSFSERSSSIVMEFDNDQVEAEVKKKLDSDPLLHNLPSDVQQYFEAFGFRDYYERLSREGSRKGRSHFKDYQSACCEIFFQELSHFRNLKVMQLMFVEPWMPSVADDLKVAMGLDKISELIELRKSLLEELGRTRSEEEGKKFVNMGEGYVRWLTPERSTRLKCLLGSIRYKGENYYDKLFQERHKRVAYIVDRTFNKLNLFDIMISVTQHACRPSLLMTPVKKALNKLIKSDEPRYQQELETWKEAESKLSQVAHYLDQLKRRVVDIIPKIDASKARELHALEAKGEISDPLIPDYRDVPRCLNTFLFLRDADCHVQKEQDGKARDTRLLFFSNFLVLLYQESKDAPERFVMRPWDHVMPIQPLKDILHVAQDRTSKSTNTLLVAIMVGSAGNTKILYLTFKDSKLMTSVLDDFKKHVDFSKNKLRLDRDKKSTSVTRYGSSVSVGEERRSKAQRSPSTVSTKSAMPSFGNGRGASSDQDSFKEATPPDSAEKDSSPEGLERQDSAETSHTLRQGSTASTDTADLLGRQRALQASLRDIRAAVMARRDTPEREFEQMADLMETEGVKDVRELRVVLVSHMSSLVEQFGKLCALDENEEGAVNDQHVAMDLTMASQQFQDYLRRYQRSDSLRHSVFDEVLTESQASSSLAIAPKISDDEIEEEDAEDVEEEKNGMDDAEEEVEKEAEEEEEEEEEDEEEEGNSEEDGTTVASAVSSDDESDDPAVAARLREVASNFVQGVMERAVERCQAEHNADEPSHSPESPPEPSDGEGE